MLGIAFEMNPNPKVVLTFCKNVSVIKLSIVHVLQFHVLYWTKKNRKLLTISL